MTHYINETISTEKIQENIREKILNQDDGVINNKTDIKIANALLKIQPATRMDLCKLTGIPRTTIYDSLTRLILKKVVTKYSVSNNSKGRPKVYYQII